MPNWGGGRETFPEVEDDKWNAAKDSRQYTHLVINTPFCAFV